VYTTTFLQPEIATRLSGDDNRVRMALLPISGVFAWMLPLLLILVLGDHCGAYWWLFLDECLQEVKCGSCSTRANDAVSEQDCEFLSTFQGVKNLTLCTRPFDICGNDDWWLSAYGHGGHAQFSAGSTVGEPSDACFALTDELCNARFPQMGMCTVTIIDTIGMLLLLKAVVAALVPLACLLLSSFACDGEDPGRRRIGVYRSRGEAGQDREVFLRLFCFNVDISTFLSAGLVVPRIVVWAQIGFAWGQMVPPLSPICLVIVAAEILCHHHAVQRFQVEREVESIRSIKNYMGCGMAVTTVIWVWHICSILDLTEDGPLAGSLAFVGIVAGYFAYPIFDRWMRQIQPEVATTTFPASFSAAFQAFQAALRCVELLLRRCFELWQAVFSGKFRRETREVELSTVVLATEEVPQSSPEEVQLPTDVITGSGSGSGSGSWNVPASFSLVVEAPQSRPVEVDLSIDFPPYVPPSLPP